MTKKTGRSATVVLATILLFTTAIAFTIAAAQPANLIDGGWTLSFALPGNPAVPGRMTLHAAGQELTGTIETEHTGAGKLEQGTWVNGQMSATCVFKTHDNIKITGELKDGTLSGSFKTEDMQGTWRATRTQ